MWRGRAAASWSPVEIEYLRSHREAPVTQLSIELAKSFSAIKRKLDEFDGKPSSGKKNKVSYIGRRADLGLSVRSAWEANFLRYLNHVGIQWQYEPRVFFFEGVKKGTISYLPDLYLPDLNLYLEIKGFLNQKAKTALRRMKKFYPEEFGRLQMVPGSAGTKAAQFAQQIGIPIYAYFADIKREFSLQIDLWE